MLVGCSSLKIASDYDKSVDFSQHKTFGFHGWQKSSDTLLNELNKRRIETAFKNEFTKRGLTYSATNPDLVVALYLVIEEKTQTTASTSYDSPMYYGRYRGYGPGWGWGPSYSTTTVSNYNYEVGTLVCDVFDASKEQLIWEGAASKTLAQSDNKIEERINKNVARLMLEYPKSIQE